LIQHLSTQTLKQVQGDELLSFNWQGEAPAEPDAI
jgi:hypothetical protein